MFNIINIKDFKYLLPKQFLFFIQAKQQLQSDLLESQTRIHELERMIDSGQVKYHAF